MMQVIALYDFNAEPGDDSEEMSIKAGEVLTVIKTDIGDGWWRGRKLNGEEGLFPELYVEGIEEVKTPTTVTPPRSTPSVSTSDSSQGKITKIEPIWLVHLTSTYFTT